MNGYTGKILHVDLTGGTFEIEEPSPDFYRRYFGGNGFIAYYLLKEMPAGADPLGPDNLLIFAGGTMTGIPIAGAGRSAVGGKSPLTGGYGEADVGGFFGAELRRAGFDAIVVRGKASSPVYLWIKDGEVEIRPAGHLWGMKTLECQETVRAEVGEKAARLAMIGPGGEKMVRYACVINDVNRAAGRTGLGAVMGSKNLKCVAARGRTPVPVADEDSLKELSRYMVEHWRDRSEGMHELGTAGGLTGLSAMGALPTRNFQDGQFEGAEKIGGETMRDTILIDRDGCFACPIRCKRVVEVKDGDFQVDPAYGGPEYETIGAFGSCCGVDDLAAVAKANELCNAYGLDTISTGMTVAFAMECFENGLLTKDDTNGLDLSFGNARAMVELTRQIGEREGLGDLLAEGATRATEKIGSGAKEFNISVKGSPFPMHECRVRHGQGLGYAVSPTGADHMHNTWADASQANDPVTEDLQGLGVFETVPATELNTHKVRAYTFIVYWRWVSNHICCCMFIPWSRDQVIQIIRAITGWQTNLWELFKMTERGLTMARVFNLREGLTKADDVLPARMAAPHKSGSLNEKPITPESLQSAVSAYYSMMGWDPETGEPTKAKLDELDIAWVKE
ncbi:MAG: aldehyde ferredoxin oxidoreductase family protein [Deltaproteobacteria bacterium]|nr:aldehyde ferredoxin oxidoreductase family protein [Deltaproteobacteria bacterium]